jgi:hypothetical protein
LALADNKAYMVEEASNINIRVALTFLTYTSQKIDLENKIAKEEQLKNRMKR